MAFIFFYFISGTICRIKLEFCAGHRGIVEAQILSSSDSMATNIAVNYAVLKY